jgi:hypothetical protein
VVGYRILPEFELVVLCFWGETTADEILSMSTALRGDPLFSESYDTLVDNTGLVQSLSGSQMRELADPRANYMDSHTKVAIIASAAATYGTSRMHQQLTEHKTPTQVGVFREQSEALEWLGRKDADLGNVCAGIRLED